MLVPKGTPQIYTRSFTGVALRNLCRGWGLGCGGYCSCCGSPVPHSISIDPQQNLPWSPPPAELDWQLVHTTWLVTCGFPAATLAAALHRLAERLTHQQCPHCTGKARGMPVQRIRPSVIALHTCFISCLGHSFYSAAILFCQIRTKTEAQRTCNREY